MKRNKQTAILLNMKGMKRKPKVIKLDGAFLNYPNFVNFFTSYIIMDNIFAVRTLRKLHAARVSMQNADVSSNKTTFQAFLEKYFLHFKEILPIN